MRATEQEQTPGAGTNEAMPSSSGLVGRLIAPMLCMITARTLIVALRDERRFERGRSLGVQERPDPHGSSPWKETQMGEWSVGGSTKLNRITSTTGSILSCRI